MKNHFTWSFIIFLSASTCLHAQELLWAKQLGSTVGETGYGIAVDNEGNTYSVGFFSQTADFDPGPGSFLLTTHGLRDIFISKLDDDGDFVWAKQIGGELHDVAMHIALDPSGYIYLTGTFRDTVDFDPSIGTRFLNGRNFSEAFIAKFDFGGNFIWAQPVTRNLDTIRSDIGNAVTVDPMGNVYVLGGFGESADFDPGPGDQIITASGEDDIFLSKFDAAGNFIWVKKIGGSYTEYPYAMAIDQQGNILCTGVFTLEVDFDPGPLTYLLTAQDSTYDVFILKLNSSGEFVWVKQISGPETEWSNGIAIDENGNCYTAGASTGSTDFNYGGNPILSPVIDYFDGYVLSLDPNGVFRWVKRIGGIDYQEAWSISVASGPNGGVYTSGYFSEEAVAENVEVPNITAKGGIDVFISKLDFNGNFKFLAGIGGPGFELPYGITLNPSTPNVAIYTIGYFSQTCDFDPGLDEFPLTSMGSSDIFIVKLDDLVTGVENITSNGEEMDFQVYPNPANSEIQINIPGLHDFHIKLTNSLGESVQYFETFIEKETLHLDVSTLPTGTYFLQLYLNEKIVTKKVMVLH